MPWLVSEPKYGSITAPALSAALLRLVLRRVAFCGFRLFFKSIRTATACLAGRLWAGL